ncbi:MAG: hypothetical protein Unbinned6747contig1000_46 [Prokaryotic dsDNA virus sp.]|nr:MAG: hypothetical protein Unbinned6747contig1000_46 [Prokaryotic dsDNA virus sp.]|tara:strand:+ start:3102 stop:4088 length:987 start_codon:yes stop_codon:yes gene_type:complete
MSTLEKSYCNTTTDLLFIEPNIGQYDGKRVLASNFTTTDTTNLYQLNNSGYVDQLYRDGIEMTAVTDSPNADNEYNYSSSTDSFQFFLASSSVSALNSSLFEASSDWATLKSDAVKRSSDFIRSYLPFPIYPNKGINTQDATGSDFPEIIVRSCAVLTCESLIRPYDLEKADQIKSQAMNDEGTGWLDMLRTGQIHLYSSESEYKKRGILREISINANTTGGIVDIKGTPSTNWDKIKIIISNGGTITEGSSNTSVKYSTYVRNDNGLKLQSKISSENIDCYWQDIGHGMDCRFSAGLYTTNDEWEVEVSGVLDQRMTPIKRMHMSRK